MIRQFALLLAVLTISAFAPRANAQMVRDSVRMSLSIYTWFIQGEVYTTCGAGVLATWPNVLQDALGSETRSYGYGNYGRVATEDMYIPYGYGEDEERAPAGSIAHNPQLASWGSNPTGSPDCGRFYASAAYRMGGGTGPLNGAPFRVTEWYATFSVPDGTPIALFLWEQAGGLAVDFDGSFESEQSREVDASAPGNKRPVASYAWDFGDGQTGTGARPRHTYDAPGTYTARLTVTDDDGEEASREETVEVFAAQLAVEVLSAREEAAQDDTVSVVARVVNTGTEAVTAVVAPRDFSRITRVPEEVAHPAGQVWGLEIEKTELEEGEEETVTRARLEPGESFEVERSYVVESTARYRIFGETAFEPQDVYVDWTGLFGVEAEPTESDSVAVVQPCRARDARCATTLIEAPGPAELAVGTRVELMGDEAAQGDTLLFVGVVKNTGDADALNIVASADFDVATVFPDSVTALPTTDPVLRALPEAASPVTRDELAPDDTLEVRRRYVIDEVATYQDEADDTHEVEVRIVVTMGEVTGETTDGDPIQVDRTCTVAANRTGQPRALQGEGTPDLPDCADREADIVPLPIGFVVNSVEDRPDNEPGDKACDTGERIDRDGEQVRECTLRAAIQEANTSGADEITFDIEGDGVHTIALATSLPPITVPIVLDATTQPGYEETPRIELDGSAAGVNATGLRVLGVTANEGTPSAIRGVAIGGFGWDGILVQEGTGTVIEKNHIGTDASGTTAFGNGRFGVWARLIGTVVIRDNVIAANDSSGAHVTGFVDAELTGNRIGTSLDGTTALGNLADGIHAVSTGNDAFTVHDNVVSSNDGAGLTVRFLTGVVITENRIGTTADGDAALGNQGDGIRALSEGTELDGRIEGNVLSGNVGRGVYVGYGQIDVIDNQIGTTADGTAALSNQGGGLDGTLTDSVVRGNVISGNGEYGIKLRFTETMPNDFDPTFGVSIVGNRIGTTADGTKDLGNRGPGLWLGPLVGGSIVGGEGDAANVISGNDAAGIRLTVRDFAQGLLRGNQIIGNYIGTDATGTTAIPNGGPGVHADYADAYSDPSNPAFTDDEIGPRGSLDGPSGPPNVISGNLGPGIWIEGRCTSSECIPLESRVAGNYIGTDATGTRPLGNGGPGVLIVHGTGAGVFDNVIGANRGGIIVNGGFDIAEGSLAIGGNVIGADDTGSVALPNQGDGIEVAFDQSFEPEPLETFVDRSAVFIGGNTIVNNLGHGLLVYGRLPLSVSEFMPNVYHTVVQDNRIGFSVSDGSVNPMGNTGDGIHFGEGSQLHKVSFNNVAYNQGAGVAVLGDSYHDLRRNSVFSNGSIPLDLGGDGLDANDFADDDLGPNGRTNHPVLVSAMVANGEVFVRGEVNAAPGTEYTLDLHVEATTGVEGFGEAMDVGMGSLKATTPLLPEGAVGFRQPFKGRFAARTTFPSAVEPHRGAEVAVLPGWSLRSTATHYPILSGTGFTSNAGTTGEMSPGVAIVAAPSVTLAASSGDDRIELSSADGFEIGDRVTICPSCRTEETRTITGFGSLIFDEPLASDHAPGEPIVPAIRAVATVLVRADTAVAFGAGTAVEMSFEGVSGAGPVEAERFRRKPDGIEGVTEPGVIPHRWVIALDSTLAFDSSSEIRFSLAEIPNLAAEQPEAFVVYHRATPGSGMFTALPTQTDSTGAFVAATGFTALGEFLFATTEEGVGTPADPSPDEAATPTVLALTSFPNPASGATTIEVALPTASDVRTEVFDLIGRRVATLHDGPLAAGTNAFSLDATRLPAGIYVVHAVTPKASLTRRLTVVR